MPFCRNEVQIVSKAKTSQAEKAITENIGRRIRDLRKRMGLNQTDFAAIGGVSLGAQQRYETGTADPGASYLARLSGAGIDVLWVVSGVHCGDTLDAEAGELVAIFEAMPADMREGLLVFARSMDRYLVTRGLVPPDPQFGEQRLLHDQAKGFRPEPDG